MTRLGKVMPAVVPAALAALLGLAGGTAVGAEPDAPARRIPRNRMAHTGWVVSVVYSPDGKPLASGSADKTILLWDVSPKK